MTERMTHRGTGTVLAAVLCATLALAGCTSDSPKAGARPASSPEKAAQRFFEAMASADSDAMVIHSDATPEERQMLVALAEFAQAGQAFRDDFIAAYGEDAWRQFNDPDHEPGEANATINLPPEDVEGLMSDLVFDVRSDEAFFRAPQDGSGPPVQGRVVKTDQGWLVDASSVMSPGAEPQKFGQLFTSMATSIRTYRTAIGHPNVSPDDIDYELGRSFSRLMFGMEPSGEHRFNIDDL